MLGRELTVVVRQVRSGDRPALKLHTSSFPAALPSVRAACPNHRRIALREYIVTKARALIVVNLSSRDLRNRVARQTATRLSAMLGHTEVANARSQLEAPSRAVFEHCARDLCRWGPGRRI